MPTRKTKPTVKVYKVVQVLGDGALSSYNLYDREKTGKFCLNPYNVVYKPGKVNRPRRAFSGTPLFAWREKKHAMGVGTYSDSIQVWEAEATEVREGQFDSRFAPNVSKAKWKGWKTRFSTNVSNAQVLYCETIKLVKRVR